MFTGDSYHGTFFLRRENMKNRWERRDKKLKNKRKHKVSGKSVFKILNIIYKKSKET